MDSSHHAHDLATYFSPRDNTLADLHYIIQIAFSWTDFHLHRFRFRKKDFAVPRIEGFVDAHDAREVTLGALRFRLHERFLYEYDFGDQWEHEVRVEQFLPLEARRKYPVCIGGQRAGPPEDCGGPQAYDDRRREAPWRVEEILNRTKQHSYTQAASCEISAGVERAACNVATAAVTSGV
jgi:Plasmid pRiA4b ORF-3-like protein